MRKLFFRIRKVNFKIVFGKTVISFYLNISLRKHQKMCRRKGENIGINTLLRAYITVLQKMGNRFLIYNWLYQPRSQDRFHFRSENKLAIFSMSVIKRFFPEAVSCAEKFLFFFIPNGKSKHSRKFIQQSVSFLFIHGQNYFCIRSSAIMIIGIFFFEIQITVNFPV